MNGIFLTQVTRKNVKAGRPAINFFAEWLTPMGFVPGALVQFLPELNGLSFTLCENIPKYSDLMRETREKGGSLIHVNSYMHRAYPNICLSGHSLFRIGLNWGDILLMRYEFGFIRIRKLPADVKIVSARLFGQWLEGLGFVPDAVLTVDSAQGLIMCQLQENGRERVAELVKHARRNKLNLLQVTPQKDNSDYPQFEIPKSRFEKAGFDANDSFFATYEYGRITLNPIDFEALGF